MRKNFSKEKAAEDFHDEIMNMFSEYRLETGLTMRQTISIAFQNYLDTHRGKVPKFGVPLEDFMAWLPLKMGEDYKSMYSVVHSLFFWEYTRTKLIIPQELNDHVLASELPAIIPVDVLKRLPQWSQWIEYQVMFENSLDPENGTNALSHGAFVSYINENGSNYLQVTMELVVFNMKQDWVDPGSWLTYRFNLDQDRPFDDAEFSKAEITNSNDLDKKLANSHIILDKAREYVLKVALFVASMQPTDESKSSLKRPEPRRKGKSYKLQVRSLCKEVVVGEEYLAVIREFNETVNREGGSRKAHIRCAHWHRYWTGAKAIQKLILKWIAPCIVSGTSEESNGK